MRVLPAGPAARPERPSSVLLHDEANARVAAFHLLPGQVVPAHRSDSTVIVQVVEGRGTFTGEDGEAVLGPGEMAVYAPGESHAITAGDVALRFVAIIAPGPR